VKEKAEGSEAAGMKATSVPDGDEFSALREAPDRFIEAMDDDFNTAAALGHIFDAVRAINRLAPGDPASEPDKAGRFLAGYAILDPLFGVLGLLRMSAKEYFQFDHIHAGNIKDNVALQSGEKSTPGPHADDRPGEAEILRRIEDRKVITYGENPQADVRFSNVRIDGTRSIFDVEIRRRRTGKIFSFTDLVLPMPGRHNVSNATAAIAVANRLGISEADIKKGLASFAGVKRRFTLTGEANGVQVFDDYGHHPVEIKAVLAAAREACKGRIIAVHQPHRYSRLSSLFDDFAHCFNDADTIILAPVYAAGEDPIEGASSEALVSAIKAAGHRDARFLEKREDLASQVAAIAKPGDFVVLLGAGNITQWAAVLPSELKSISGKSE
jgi:hypothetical protein